MANSNFRHTLTLEGIISARPREREINAEGSEKDTLHGMSFELTSERETRQNRAGADYFVDPKWNLSVFNFEGDTESESLFNAVSDLQIGDKVSVQVAVLSAQRRGYPVVNLRVLDLTNDASA